MSAYTFPLNFGRDICWVSKIEKSDFDSTHQDVLDSLQYADGSLVLADARWKSIYLGAGEEKAVYCICDHNQHVFALEVINENTYLNGRLIDGDYFFDRRIQGLVHVKPNADSLYRFAFTGLVKAREYIYGCTWDRFQFDSRRKGRVDQIITPTLQTVFQGQMSAYRSRYQDVHDRNVMFEIRPPGQSGWPVIFRDGLGSIRRGSVALRAIDVR